MHLPFMEPDFCTGKSCEKGDLTTTVVKRKFHKLLTWRKQMIDSANSANSKEETWEWEGHQGNEIY